MNRDEIEDTIFKEIRKRNKIGMMRAKTSNPSKRGQRQILHMSAHSRNKYMNEIRQNAFKQNQNHLKRKFLKSQYFNAQTLDAEKESNRLADNLKVTKILGRTSPLETQTVSQKENNLNCNTESVENEQQASETKHFTTTLKIPMQQIPSGI